MHENYIYQSPKPNRKPSHPWFSWHNHTGCYPRFSVCPTIGLSPERYLAELQKHPDAYAGFAITDHAFSIAIPDPNQCWPHCWFNDRTFLDECLTSGVTEQRVQDYLAFAQTYRQPPRLLFGVELEANPQGHHVLPSHALAHCDVRIASVHFFFGNQEPFESRIQHYLDHLDCTLQLPADFLGHPVRNLRDKLHPESPLPQEIIDEILNRVQHAQMGIEINAHHHHHAHQFADDVALLQGATARKLPIAFSLDLHYPEEFGNWRYFEDVVEAADIPYDALPLFTGKQHP